MVFDSVLRVTDGMVELLPDFSPPIALPHVTKTLLKHVRVPYQSIIFYRKDVWSPIELINSNISEMRIFETIIEHNSPYLQVNNIRTFEGMSVFLVKKKIDYQ